MWITVFLVCLTGIFSCRAQVTNNDVNAVTETARTNQEVEWDTTGPPVTLNVSDGRPDITNIPRNELSSHPLFYSNQWHPFLLPIGRNSDRDINNRQHSEGDGSANYHFMPTFLRRPNSDLNHTSPSPIMQYPNSFRYPFGSMPMPMAPFNPMLFYPHQPNLFPSGGYRESDISDVLQNSSTQTRPAPSTTEATNLKYVQENIVPSPPLTALPDVLERFHPYNVYRNREDFLSQTRPAFLPYPVAPNANDNYVNPVIFSVVNSPLYDRERSSDAIESIPTGHGVTESEVKSNSRDVHGQKANIVSSTPSDFTTNFVPPEPLPLPIAGFPFGVLPPPIFPSIISGPATPVNPMADSISLPEETEVFDAVLPYPPTQINNPPLETSPGLLIPGHALKSEEELPATSGTNAERTVLDKRPNETKIPYEFGFDMNDGQGTDQHRKEVSDVSGTVRGSYGYRDLYGVYRFVNYIADKNGFRAFIKSNEPGVASSGSANVVVLAEQPLVQTIAEGAKLSDPDPVIIPDTFVDLVAEGSETKKA